jgi:signal transduction histidine kinase/CheY-like chemotaxis protein/HPt (histidine-containing phosphotransfer) domain-containing protein
MKRLIKHLRPPSTLSGKLVLLSTTSLVFATVLVFILVTFQQQRLLRTEWVESLSAQANLIASNSRAAIAFGDPYEANRLLESVATNPFVLGARLILPSGQTFARYIRPSPMLMPSMPPPANGSGHVFGDDTLTVWAPVIDAGKHQASVELVAALAPMREAFNRTALRTAATLLIALAVSLLISRRVVRRLSAPVEQLNKLMQRMAANMTLSERADIRGDDEIAGLAHGLNQLIEAVQVRDRELAQYRDNLEQLVVQRTQALNQAIQEAQQANRAKSNFLARMSHEIRTPMNAIVGLGRLLMKTRLDAQQRDYQDKVLASSDALLGVINDVLDYSRIEAGKLSLEAIPFEINQVIHKVAGVVAFKAQEKGLELLFQIEPDVPRWPVGDPMRLAQILVNLVNNAIKFTETGEVLVKIARQAEVDDQVTLRFSVRDSGIGIPAARQQDLFTPFTQVDDSITRRFGGTGLGLSICKQLTEMMGGEIGVESTPGQGSLFYFTARLGINAHPALGDRHSHHLAGRHVLVVDDNASARAVLDQMLNYFGMRVDTCASGDECLQRLRAAAASSDPYHLVMLDWLMPGIDGIETSRRIHAASDLGEIPAILMITASGYETINPKMAEAGLAHLLVKPVSESSLHDALLEVLLGGSMASAHHRFREQQRTPHFDFTLIRGARVLLVDDVALNREVAREILREAGVRVETAKHGREAVDKVLQGGYSLVLMDIQMPVLDGLAAAREIRADARFHDLPILAMTAHVMTGDREESLAAGMNDHLTKPIDPPTLYRALLHWIPAGNYATEAPMETASNSVNDATLPPLAGIDVERGLANHMRRPAFYRRILAQFNQEFGSATDDIVAALAVDNYELARRLAHSVKSAAATIGAEELSQRARILEHRLAAGKPASAELIPFRTALTCIVKTLAPLAQEPRKHAATGSLEIDTALAVIDRIEVLLKHDDAAAETMLSDLESCLSGPDWHGELHRLRDLIEDIEYEAALTALKQLRGNLEGASP